MKQLCTRVLMFVLVAAVGGLSVAQQPEMTLTTDGGVTVTYPAAWSAEASGPTRVSVTNPDGWLIAIAVGADANYGFTGSAYATPAEIMQQFILFMRLSGAKIGTADPAVLEIGIIAGLHQTLVTETGVPLEAVAYTLPDGMSVLALAGNEDAPQPVTPEIRDTFFAVLSSVSFEEPVIEAEEAEIEETSDETPIPTGTIRISDLEPGSLRFSVGAEATYPAGWVTYSANNYIRNNISLIYGEDIFDYDALAIITVQDSADMTIETFRDAIMPISAMLYTGRDTFDPERDIITETLSDGRTFEYLDVTDTDTINGNLYVIGLNERYWAWTMLTTLDPESGSDRAAEISALMQNISLVSPDSAVEYEGVQFTLQEATCDRALTLNDVSQSMPNGIFQCPAGCGDQSYTVWGSDIYTLDSSVCAAAIHAGAISNEDGGTVLATWQAGLASYSSTERNGVVTSAYGAWSNSVTFEPFTLVDDE